VALQPGESKDVSFTLCKRAFAYWNSAIHDWHVETGEFVIEIGQSSRRIEVSATVTVESTVALPRHYTMDTIFMDIMADPRAVEVLKPLLDGIQKALTPSSEDRTAAASEAITEEMNLAMLNYMPLRGALSFGGGAIDVSWVQALLDELNR